MVNIKLAYQFRVQLYVASLRCRVDRQYVDVINTTEKMLRLRQFLISFYLYSYDCCFYLFLAPNWPSIPRNMYTVF